MRLRKIVGAELQRLNKKMEEITSPEKAMEWLRGNTEVSDQLADMASHVTPIPNSVTGAGLGLYSYYARVTTLDSRPGHEGKMLSGEIELAQVIESAPPALKHLLMSGLQVVTAKALKRGLFTEITPDNCLEYVRLGTEKMIEQADRAILAEQALAEAQAEFTRQINEMMEANRHAVAMLQQQHRDELASARRATHVALEADAQKIEAADRRAAGWKRATRGIRQRYMHWKVAAITAYNILEGRNEPVPIIPITESQQPEQVAAPEAPVESIIQPESAPKPVRRDVKPLKSLLTPEERKRRQSEGARNRWANTTPEERSAHAAMMHAKRNVH